MKQNEIETLPDGSKYKECAAFRVSNGTCDNAAFRGFPESALVDTSIPIYKPRDMVSMTIYAKRQAVEIDAGDIVIRRKC